jgi:hypothetical protein
MAAPYQLVLINPESHEQLTAALIYALQADLGGIIALVKRFSIGDFARHVDELVQGIAR